MKLLWVTSDQPRDAEPTVHDVDGVPSSVEHIYLTRCPCCTETLVIVQPVDDDCATTIGQFAQTVTAEQWIEAVVAPLQMDWGRPLGESMAKLGSEGRHVLARSAAIYKNVAHVVQQFHLQFIAGAIPPDPTS